MLKLRPIHVLVFVVALVLLGALAWGVGWAAHSLVGRPTTDPTPEATFTLAVATAAGTPATPVLTPAGVSPATVPPTSTPQPTSTPVSTLTLPPVEEWETVRQGEGVIHGLPSSLSRKVACLRHST